MLFGTLPDIAAYSFQQFCSPPRRMETLSELPNDPGVVEKARKLAKFRALWLHDEAEGAWYFNSVYTLGGNAYTETVTLERKELWERGRRLGIFNRGPETRGHSNLATSLQV